MAKPSRNSLKPQYRDLVEVIWHDAHYGDTYWFYEMPLEPGIVTIKTLGYFISQTDNLVTIAQSVGDDISPGGLFNIPTGCILEVRKLK